MTNIRKIYEDKLTTAKEAVKNIHSGDTVVFHAGVCEPEVLIEAMVARADELRDVKVVHMTSLGQAAYTLPEMKESFRHVGLFISTPTRKAVNEGRADFVPCSYSQVPKLFREHVIPVNVFLMEVTPPDEEGFCSYGLTADYAPAAVEVADIVIAQINDQMPRTAGNRIHLEDITYIVEKSEPIHELIPGKMGEVEKKIARNVASLISDGDTLQLGIGAVPDMVLSYLTEKKDLGIHSEMFSDGVLELYEKGVITNKKKTLHNGKFVATFLLGTKKLYDFVDNNPDVLILPVDYTNDPYIIGQNDNMVSINSALQVDLTGQVNAETLGVKHFTGIGGQLDFIRGAARSKGGKSIIALPSTASHGKVSRIVNDLGAGSAVTTPRGDVHYIVTEYGIADLRGKSLTQRIHELASIAHPDFRDMLLKEAAEMGRNL